MSEYVYGFGQAPRPPRPAAPRPRPRPAGRPGRGWRPRGRRRHHPPVAWGYPYPPIYQPAIYEPVIVMPPDPFVEACEAVGGAYARGICWLPDGSTRTRAQMMLLR